jgi:hypothetical protein
MMTSIFFTVFWGDFNVINSTRLHLPLSDYSESEDAGKFQMCIYWHCSGLYLLLHLFVRGLWREFNCVEDPDPEVFGPPGFGSISQRKDPDPSLSS